ncbi:hypothetical protein N9B23_00295 [bacterium]|nr:hypothetical protein [bacterium]
MTIKNATVYKDLDDLKPVSVLPKGSLVLAIGVCEPTGRYRRVKLTQADEVMQWVRNSDLIAAKSAFSVRRANGLMRGEQVIVGGTAVPLLIQFSDLPNIVKIYEEAAAVYLENRKAPPEDRIPEPCIARGEIWELVGNYPDAVSDYVEGVGYARSRRRDPKIIEKYHNKIAGVLEKIKSMPVPMNEPNARYEVAAVDCFGRGLHQLKVNQLSTARHHFSDAIQLKPASPAFWYARAVANHRADRELEARHDAVMGNLFERDLPSWETRKVASALQGIQGADRAWLESFRDGTALHELYGF